MRDPHVVSLKYRAVPSPTSSYERAIPSSGTFDRLRYTLDKGTLVVEPLDHFPSIEDARNYVDPLVQAWEVDIALRYGSSELGFSYETADVVDRDPPPPGPRNIVMVATAGELNMAGSITIHVERARYPEPPSLFRTSPDVDTLWRRYQGYKAGREPLPSMAYFCLTLLESTAGSRPRAARAFKISTRVLSKLGELATQRGDAATARKYAAIKSGAPLGPREVQWLEEAIKLIIRRVGEAAAIARLDTINMSDLPPLQ